MFRTALNCTSILQSDISSDFQTTISYAFHTSPMYVTCYTILILHTSPIYVTCYTILNLHTSPMYVICYTNLILLSLIKLTFGAEYKYET